MEELKQSAVSESPHLPNRNMESVSPGTSYQMTRLNGPTEFSRNWVELRLLGQQPDRRSYHSSFVYDKKLYVFGGLDIREGSLDTLFELNLQLLGEINQDELNSPSGDPMRSNHSWKEVQTTGNIQNIPSKIAYHSSCVYKDKMYLFGGNSQPFGRDEDDVAMYADKLRYLDLRTLVWQND